MNGEKRKDRTASLKHEREFFSRGFQYILGLDEVGRGPWAGPVVVGAVALPLARRDLSRKLKGVKDSKQMTHLQRVTLVEQIKDVALAWGIGEASAAEISTKGINPATQLAMQRALEAAMQMQFTDADSQTASFRPDCLFLDYMAWPEQLQTFPQLSIVAGDQHSLSIAAASVLAKVHRDAFMVQMAEKYPQYGFASNKGYGTEAHRAALQQYGVTPLHRTNYRPVLLRLKG